MSRFARLGRALAVLALSTTVVGLTAGTASARPVVNCDNIEQAIYDSWDLAWSSWNQGDIGNGDDWFDTYQMASHNWQKWCSG